MSLDIMCMDCGEGGAGPIFTAPLSSITKKRRTRQPKWYCADCRRKYHRVSPTTGRRVVSVGGLNRERIVARKGVIVSGETST